MARSATPPRPRAADEAVAQRLHAAAIHLLRLLRRRDASLGVGPARLSALSVLVFGGPRTLGALAEAEGVRPPTMTRIVAGLERAGLVRRDADPRDARAVRLEATAAGRRLLHLGRRRRVRELARRLRALRDAEVAVLDRAAGILEDLVRGEAGGAAPSRGPRR